MYPNQAFSSGSYAEMMSGTSLLPHEYSESFAGDSHVVPRTQMGIVDSEQNMQCQGLSLSLGTHMPSSASLPPFQYQYHDTGLLPLMTDFPNLKGTMSFKDDEANNLHKELTSAECMASVSSGGFHDIIKKEGFYNPHPSMCLKEYPSDLPGYSNGILNSQYLKAAQDLLDEIVSVRKALKQPGMEKQDNCRDIGLDGSKDSDGKSNSQSLQMSSGPNASSELSPSERQNLLDKKTKLLSMLDEVDKKYRQYCHQMQIVVSSFDMVAGCGAAEPYTTLALRTISRHFRCLRDAISGQIQATQKSLGEQEGIPRLRYVDQQLRQQKALQQLGVMRQAWRPQRGLPESSVSILRAWLFEHFLHPYPKDSEKIMLARQTGLTRNQVANWFINARVRLWKPMVEEMYKEEFGDSEMNCNLASETTVKGKRDDVQESDNNNKWEESQENLVTVESVQGQSNGENVVMDSGGGKLQGNQKQRLSMNNNYCISSNNNQNGGGESLMGSSPHGTYDISELGNFTMGGHVSLALELRNCESDGFTMSDDGIHKRRNQTLASSPETDLLDYHFTDSGKQQHRHNNVFPEALGAFPEGSEISHTRHLMDLLGAANETIHHQPQGLSLSLGSHMHQRPLNPVLINPNYFMSAQQQEPRDPPVDHLTSDYFFNTAAAGTFASSSSAPLNRSPSTSYAAESFAAVIGNSRYLKPVQSLLEDLVDVGGNVVDRINEKYADKLFRRGGARTLSSELKAELRNNAPLLADKHEHQIKIARLISLLDEVEGRCEKYYHQMEEVVSSFEMIAGLGAAKCYTALALQAMSRHFCSLRDAILSQINAEKRKLFQDLPKISSGLSQLSLFDRDSRQSRMSLQQLGVIQSQRQVWRPIRGLPETSVAILRSWLFEHFLHPYPNDSEKLMLASQTGLTKNQVSNWFINARVRLWKPMIEEMYKEEFGESSEDSNPAANNYLTREDTTDCVED
ncbi:BEL1-like homeodomain protein 3, partial [Mucuna pruriens]